MTLTTTTMVFLMAAAILGFVAGTTLIISRQCVDNPSMCPDNNGNQFFYYWTTGQRPIVATGSGDVRGVTWTSRDGKAFSAFLGIPYAQVETRFEPAKPYPKWDEVREAATFGPVCLQVDRKKWIISGSEDCLFLNVYSPQISNDSLLPVMVWIDGSLGWQHGSGDKVNPKNFMDEKVVLVTFNFRQSSLGFLSSGDGEVQGNFGLKDQVLALTWVKKEIKNFGGDPDRVTIFGSDSGAASVHLHMLSPMSKGLFHRAISQSGSAHCPWTLMHNAASKFASLAEQLDCNGTSTKSKLDCIRSKSGEEVVMAEWKMKNSTWNGEPYATFGPTVEKSGSNRFLDKTPRELISSRGGDMVPWIVGFNEEEGRYFGSKVLNSVYLTNELNTNWKSLAPISFFYEDIFPSQAEKDSFSSRLQNTYFGGRYIGRGDTWENYTNLYTDRYYLSGIMESVKGHGGVVYPYILKYKSDLTYYTGFITGEFRIKRAPSHFDELFYLFNWEWTLEQIWYTNFSKKLVKMWVTFAETGVPQGWGSKPDWPQYSPSDNGTINWYVIDADTSIMADDPGWEIRLDYWKSANLRDDSAL